MGDRANIIVREDEKDKGVVLYSHWEGTNLPAKLQAALAKKQRLDDHSYLTRIIFDTMTENCHGEETGYGISTFVIDGCKHILIVSVMESKVFAGYYNYCDHFILKKEWTFDQYTALTPEEIALVWSQT